MNFKNIAYWAMVLFLAVIFVMSGGGKLAQMEMWQIIFVDEWNLPAWMVPITGVTEIVAGLMLLIPRLTSLGAAVIVMVMIGATGMLGRPVARRLVLEQRPVRALVRDPQRARTLLPEACELVKGDVRDQSTLHAAIEGSHAVYINLSEPFSRRKRDTEHEGTRAIARAARSVNA